MIIERAIKPLSALNVMGPPLPPILKLDSSDLLGKFRFSQYSKTPETSNLRQDLWIFGRYFRFACAMKC
jgi:hypothetical protein